MTWDFFYFKEEIKLQIDTKVNVIGLVEVLKKCQTHENKGEPWNNSTIFEGPVHDMRPSKSCSIYAKQHFHF